VSPEIATGSFPEIARVSMMAVLLTDNRLARLRDRNYIILTNRHATY
jgi:hypothetical protein